jgi:hypothetical protein
VDLRQPLDEVHGDVRPDLGRHLKGLQQASRLERLGLVVLARRACPYMVLDETLVVWDVELCTEALERLLYALMTHCMD